MTTTHRPIVEFKDVKKNYKLGETIVPAIKGVSFTLNAGEFTTLIGASGSGKSTLLNLTGCIDRADGGHILIDGEDTTKMDEKNHSRIRNEKIGYIFQAFNLIPVLSVFDNIELPLLLRTHMGKDERRSRIETALADVGLEKFRNHKPDQLSGGQRQRVAIARALVTEPVLVLADEPTANLDSETTHKIVDLMLEMNTKRKVTFLFSSHDEKLIERVTRTIRIKDGVIVQ
jgi:putative ABC transport system ATP-binding protein